MTSKPLAVLMRIEDFDLTPLPKEYRNINATGFKQALNDYLEEDYGSLGLFAHIVVDNEIIRVDQDVEATEQSEIALDLLQRSNYLKGKAILEKLLPKYPKNTIVLYNLGMVYSDEGNLIAAIDLLGQATKISPNYTHAWVALAVAYARNRNLELALQSANKALELDSEDPYVMRTAGAIIAQTSRIGEALPLLENAVKVAPEDSIALFALAEALRAEGPAQDKKRASCLYERIIELAPGSSHAEQAKDRQRLIAYETFRNASGLRQDAVMYCLDSLKIFADMPTKAIAGVAMESATLGQNGLDVNNPNKKYELRTIPGTYSGLNVVCILHSALQQVAPGTDSGFAIQAEYEEALKLFNLKD